jgi:hypothetical protein
MVAIARPGLLAGAPFIGYDTALCYGPHYITKSGGTLTTTSTRAYYIPYFVGDAISFSSIRTYNQGAGDNGDTYRLAIYANDGTAGPGTLIQDIGQVTLTGASARRTITATINLSAYANQWVWVMFHSNQAVAMYDMQVALTAGEYTNGTQGFGTFEDFFSGTQANAAFRYVDTAYGAAASTAVAPTNSLQIAPAFALVK